MNEKQYYYLNGTTRMGPFSLDTLKHAPIKADTLVWNNSLSDWVEARSLPELQFFFVTSPQLNEPAISPQNQYTQSNKHNPELAQQYSRFNTPPPMPDNYLVWGILTLLFCFWPLSIVSIVNASKVSSCYFVGDYEGARKASEDAKKWATWSALTALIIIGVVLFLYFFFIIAIVGIGVGMGNV